MCRPTIVVKVNKVNKTSKTYVKVKYTMLFMCFVFFELSEVPDLARASLSLGLFMAQEEAKPVKEGHGDFHGSLRKGIPWVFTNDSHRHV